MRSNGTNQFSLEHLTTLPWADAVATAETFFRNTSNLSLLPPHQIETIVRRDLNLLIDRSIRAARQLASKCQEAMSMTTTDNYSNNSNKNNNINNNNNNNNNRNGSSSTSTSRQAQKFFAFASSTSSCINNNENDESAALDCFLRFVQYSLDNTEGKLYDLFGNNNFHLLRLIRSGIFTDCVLKLPMWQEARGSLARRAAFNLLHHFAEVPVFKDFIADEFFVPLFSYLAELPLPMDDASDDDFSARRLCAQTITSAIRGSKRAKQLVLTHKLLEKLTPLIRDTPTGDFFLQVQCFEIVYRVTRQGAHVIPHLGLPDIIANPLASNTSKLADSENFVINLIDILDVYNSHRSFEQMKQLKSKVNSNNNNGDASSSSFFATSAPIFSYRVAAYEIAVEESSSSPSTTTTVAPQPSNRILLSRSTQQETQILFSPRMAVLIIPQMNGINHAFYLRQLATFRISREHTLSFTFKSKIDREFMKTFFGCSDSVLQSEEEFRNIQDRVARHYNHQHQQQSGMLPSSSSSSSSTSSLFISFTLSLDPAVGQELRQGPVQGWVKDALERKKLYQNLWQMNVMNQKANVDYNICSSKTNDNNDKACPPNNGSSRVPSPIPCQQNHHQQEQQHSVQFGSRRDPNSTASAPTAASNQNSNLLAPNLVTTANKTFVAMNNTNQPPPQQQQQPFQQQQSSSSSSSSAPPSLSNMLFAGFDFNNNNNNNNANTNRGGWNTNNNNNARLSISMSCQGVRAGSTTGLPTMPMSMNNNNNNNHINSNNNNNNNDAAAFSGGAKALFAQGMTQYFEQQRQRQKQEHSALLQEAMRHIERRMTEVRNQDRQDRDDFEEWIQQEASALRSGMQSSHQRATDAIRSLSSAAATTATATTATTANDCSSSFMTMHQINALGKEIEQDLEQLKQLISASSNDTQRFYYEKSASLKKDIEAALQECSDVVAQISAENALPEEFVRQFGLQQQHA